MTYTADPQDSKCQVYSLHTPPLTFRSSHNVVVTLNPRSPQEDEPRSAECDRERTAPWLPFDSEVCERRPDSDPEGDGECFS